ncbi:MULTISPECIES: MraY family glycosyltransferase [Stenotrophomonas]|jgi:UDP-N-acetylmuramyl pentapeptide phosphotransferase/UDP-N-acetylglucosamine-1-phosphate transferase|uniref:Glycosyltransferase family 4 protein n=1 Tax=Stenotrophomonas riyadhensis TaxID=2859893 RepID=A0ABT2XC43_9GAMM|nr:MULTISPECIES: glycosyltransferase family 4 protein [Stenotrophomonas]MBA0286939.1 glycosyltransferase family 4 protein [Stenotrophomonas maltophilia]MBA0325557.1 glycosyltransferase family 4 protein [Stenotrophomonas maltophilia]MBA0361414.1 glycosyltransferase family 4 protein [Stenotrophomonas maltophilia]MBH1617191.1 glycosyltransferase family 4 protein [Stenotrophomonas maltophilia]MCV0323503.1 glycosyltransferase family 4 protein [Stenotrophomonas sp. CFS3442]
MPWLVMGALLGLALLSAALTWAARGYALRQQLMDQPGERRSHSVATPRGGGIAIVISLLVTAGVAMWIWPESAPSLLVASLGLVLVAGIGWWDDHRPLPAMRRLLVHFIAAALLAALVKVHGGSWLLAALVLLFTASLINIWNFMDGINGIAASQAIVVALGLAPVLPWPYSLAAVALGLACLGFLPFNFPRARIFMGDVGSGALGYAVAAVLALASVQTDIHWILLLVPASAFLVDAGFTLLARIISGQRWMEPHTQHVYQRAVQAGASHAQVTGMYFALGLFSITVLNVCSNLQPRWEAVVAIAWFSALSALWLFLRNGLRHRQGTT